MRRVLTLVIVLLAMSVITSGIAHAAATRTEIMGTIDLTATSTGDVYVTKSGIIRQVGGEASGPIDCPDLRVKGQMQIVLNVIFNLKTEKGVGRGSFTISNAAGTFEGVFNVWDTNFIFFTGRLEGRGTNAYEGMMLHLEFSGKDWYRDNDPNTNGIEAIFAGYIMSPHGI
jgi:hypothetical protein